MAINTHTSIHMQSLDVVRHLKADGTLDGPLDRNAWPPGLDVALLQALVETCLLEGYVDYDGQQYYWRKHQVPCPAK